MKKTLQFILFSLLVLLSACTLPATGVPQATLEPYAIYTEAVLTIVAQYTQTAQSTTSMETQATLLPQQTEVIQPSVTPPLVLTETPAPTATPTVIISPTSLPPAATPTFSADDPRLGLGEPAFEDLFNDTQNWPIYSDEHVKIIIENGNMAMTARKPDFFNSWVLTWAKPANFYLEASVTMGACGGRDRYGLIFRVPEVSVDEGYLFAFSCEGKYSIWYWDGEKEMDLVDWLPNDKILAGEGKTNRIGVRANGNQFALYANGSLITTLTDARLSEGYFGAFVGSAQTENFSALFNEIAYWEIK
jgi:hypothetical protein